MGLDTFCISGIFDLWVESSELFGIVDGELQIGRDFAGNAFPHGLHFKTTRLLRVIELLNDDGTKAKKLPRDARWVVRISSLERYLNPNTAPGEDETFQSRVQAYRTHEWLTLEQASDWIEIISGSAVDDSHLYAMAEFGNCSMYVDASGLKGQTEVKYRPSPQQAVRGLGICQVVTPLVAAGQDTHLYGPVEFIGGHYDGRQETNCSWRIAPPQDYVPLFKPGEIEEIARMTTASGRWSSQTSAIAEAAEATPAAKPADECAAAAPSGPDSLEHEVGNIAEQDLLQATAAVGLIPHRPKMRLQEDAILRMLSRLGYVASDLPQRTPGKSGVRAEVWDALKDQKSLFTTKSFQKAWERLRDEGQVAEQGTAGVLPQKRG